MCFSLFRSPVQKLMWLCVFWAISPSSYAEADGPDFWQVRDVAKNDVLNVRRYADFRAPKTGEIPPDAQCIINRGCKGGLTYHEFTTLSEAEKRRILKQRPRWCRVSYQGLTGWVAGRYLQEAACTPAAAEDRLSRIQGVDPYNHRYRIERETVSLHRGSSRKPIAGSTASIITEVAMQPKFVDLNNDGFNDAVLILMQQTGGSGTFYYLAVALGNVATGPAHADVTAAHVVESCFLGDRIKIEQVSLVDNVIVVDYLDHAKGQPMSGQAVVRSHKRCRLIGDTLTAFP
jgi:hypothetical protein